MGLIDPTPHQLQPENNQKPWDVIFRLKDAQRCVYCQGVVLLSSQ